MLGIGTVKLVVRRHYGPGVGLLHHDLEALERHFAKSPGVDPGVVLHAVGLLVVGRIVLGADTNSVALDAADIGRRHLAGQKRILREILEVAAAERVAVQVETRCKKYVCSVLLDFLAHSGSELFHQRCIPSRGQDRTYRESGGIKGLVSAGARRIDADAGRTVCEDGLGDAEARDGTGRAGGAGDERLVGRRHRAGDHAAPAGAYQQRGLLLKGHGLEDLVDVVLLEFRLGKDCGCAQRQSKGDKEFLHCGLSVIISDAIYGILSVFPKSSSAYPAEREGCRSCCFCNPVAKTIRYYCRNEILSPCPARLLSLPSSCRS